MNDGTPTTIIRYYPSLVLCGPSCLACRVNISTIRRMLQLYVSSSRCLVSFGSDDTTNWCNFVTYIIADRRCSTRQIKEIQSLGNRSLRGILVLRYEKTRSIVSVLFVGTLSRSSILFSVYRVSGKITFSYVQHSSGSVCACFIRFRTSIVRTKL